MHSVFIAVIVFGGLVLALAVIGSTILMGLKIIRGGAISKGQKIETDETKMIQEIYQGLSDMEERLEALETILLDREKDRKGKQP
jgi:phage shock protein B